MNRREFLKYVSRMGLGALLFSAKPWLDLAEAVDSPTNSVDPLTKLIPSSGEQIPVIGMGTWQTFDVGRNVELIAHRTQVLKRFFELGGGMIDSSPMYGSSEEVLGYTLENLGHPESLFSASKIWTMRTKSGPKQFADSQRLWKTPTFDLFQVHNLLNWKPHLKLLRKLKKQGKIRYVGITTSHGRRHEDIVELMSAEPMDFIQVTYNILDREVEDRILPLARERGIAVIVNRPYQGGRLFSRFQRKKLPEWSQEIGCQNWAEFFLKFIVSHPAVTCAIPATSKINHMSENMRAGRGHLPNAQQRQRMLDYIQAL